ncbi:hypothetical protein JCM10212_003819 [Sporobolomyces blumeae]
MARTVTVTIVRHGETDHNKAGIIQGHLDVPLNDQGVAQGRVTAKWFRDQSILFDRAYSSDLSRAKKTAQLILAQQPGGGVELVEDERIRERYLGNLQGKRRGDPGTDPSTVEPVAQLRSRLFSFWDDVFPPSSTSPTTTSTSSPNYLYVSHGAAIREFLQALITDPSTRHRYDLASMPPGEEEMLRTGAKRIGNCARTVIEMTQDEKTSEWHGKILCYADDSHFIDSSRAPSPRANADIL